MIQRQTLFRLMFSCLMVTSQVAFASSSTEVRFHVDRAGLKWTGPCTGNVFDGEGANASEVETIDNLDGAVFLAPGTYTLMATCPSTEGVLRHTETLRVGKKALNKTVKIRAGFVLAVVTRHGKEREAEVIIEDQTGRELQKGDQRVPLVVAPGRYTVRAVIANENQSHGLPIGGQTSVQVKADKKKTVTIDASDGTLTVLLSANGKKAAGVAALRFAGQRERLMELVAGEATSVPPGVYDVVTQLDESHDAAEKVAQKIRIKAKQKKSVKVNHPVTMLKPVLTLDKKPLARDENVEIDIFAGEAATPFNTVDRGETIRVKPGLYRLRARFVDKMLDDGTAWYSEGSVMGKKKRTHRVGLDLTPCYLKVETTLAGEARSLPVQVLLDPDQEPIAKQDSNETGEALFRLQSGTHHVRVQLPQEKRTLEKTEQVYLVRGAHKRRGINLDAARVVIQVFENQVAVSARVALYAQNKTSTDGKETAYAIVRAGEEIYLPPGVYDLEVMRKGQKKSFSPIRVAAGRQLTRQLELMSER